MLAIADAQGNPHVAAAAGNLILIDVRLSPRLSRHTRPSRLPAVAAAQAPEHAGRRDVDRDGSPRGEAPPARRARSGRQTFPGRGMPADVGCALQSAHGLLVEIVVIRKRAAVEEALADVADRALHFALGLGPIGSARARHDPQYGATIWVRARVASFKNVPEFSDRCLTKMFLRDPKSFLSMRG